MLVLGIEAPGIDASKPIRRLKSQAHVIGYSALGTTLLLQICAVAASPQLAFSTAAWSAYAFVVIAATALMLNREQ